MIDWNRIKNQNDLEIYSQEAILQVSGYRKVNSFTVQVFQNSTTGNYFGECEYYFWGPDQATPYYPGMRLYETIEDAFNNALDGFTRFDNVEYPNEVVFLEKKINGEKVYIDGNGDSVTYEEAQSRRDIYRENRNTNTALN